MWGKVLSLLGKAVMKAKKVDPSDVMTQSTGNDFLDLLRDLLL